jgi:hypothetical protein
MTFTFLSLTRGGWVAIHRAGCRDIAKSVRRGDANDGGWNAEAESAAAAIAAFFAENDFDAASPDDVTVFPCCKEGKR